MNAVTVTLLFLFIVPLRSLGAMASTPELAASDPIFSLAYLTLLFLLCWGLARVWQPPRHDGNSGTPNDDYQLSETDPVDDSSSEDQSDDE